MQQARPPWPKLGSRRVAGGKLFIRPCCAAGVCCLTIALLAGCASRPTNPPLLKQDHEHGYRLSSWQAERGDPEFGLVVAMSGGGTRAAAFSYGILEELRRTTLPTPTGPGRMLDDVNIVTGISGGSFTALSYALFGERLFDEFEPRFLKRDVQGDLMRLVLNPLSWPQMTGGSFTRTDLAADYYDRILFEGATFGDLRQRGGPFTNVAATEVSTGSRITFNQNTFDLLCSDLSQVRLARAAAASSAVPGLFAPIGFDNYAGSCGFDLGANVARVFGSKVDKDASGRVSLRDREFVALQDGTQHRYLHLIDGGLSDNVGLRSLLEGLEASVASERFRDVSGFNKLKRIAVIAVNSLADGENDWGRHEAPPNMVSMLVRAAGVPIDRYSYEQIELLRNFVRTLQHLKGPDGQPIAVEFYAIDINFDQISDPEEKRYFRNLPTSFVLSAEQVDRLREMAGRLLRQSPDFQRLLRDLGASALPSESDAVKTPQ
ncbi:patatin-like phospholipase family protein [Paucibacter sp. B2R-40]|uniref:patatin-like phospholipase family protein n=1 Tax=Paucibacter sp. B2R-40 TaxID=2893554 RepID=UPI0021E444FD|nr:patatin-like phospholipase family protein [Paucibacter sp. B2R-40]MCV2356060.1 patatin-like phospholipase family protein [Paucibacter sp. B2R-40]